MGSSLASTSKTTGAGLTRLFQIGGCSVLVSVGSYFMFPQTFIYFGVLHAMVVMLILSRFFMVWPRWLLGVAVLLCWSAPHLYTMAQPDFQIQAMLNATPWNIMGLITAKPLTEDFVPLLPWLGVFLAGLFYGQWRVMKPEFKSQPLRYGRSLARQGRWSLTFYMFHQPILLGVLTAYRWFS